MGPGHCWWDPVHFCPAAGPQQFGGMGASTSNQTHPDTTWKERTEKPDPRNTEGAARSTPTYGRGRASPHAGSARSPRCLGPQGQYVGALPTCRSRLRRGHASRAAPRAAAGEPLDSLPRPAGPLLASQRFRAPGSEAQEEARVGKGTGNRTRSVGDLRVGWELLG